MWTCKLTWLETNMQNEIGIYGICNGMNPEMMQLKENQWQNLISDSVKQCVLYLNHFND